jgi:multiple sugar transport system substrate-binding protein
MYGGKDFAQQGGKFVSQVNSPESVEFNKKFVELVKKGSTPQWSSLTWMQCQSDLGAGKAAIEWDATNNPIQVTLTGMQEKGNIYFAPSPAKKAGDKVMSNLWVWGIAMNSKSKNKDGAWAFMQFVTEKEFLRKASVDSTLLDPVRQSVWDDAGFKA